MTTGVVTAVRAGQIDVELRAPPRCAGCDGACFWYRPQAVQRSTLTTDAEVSVGTKVAIALPDRYLLLAASLLYGVPLAALLLGAALGAAFLGSEAGAIAGAALAVSTALLVAAPLRRSLERRVAAGLRVVRLDAA